MHCRGAKSLMSFRIFKDMLFWEHVGKYNIRIVEMIFLVFSDLPRPQAL